MSAVVNPSISNLSYAAKIKLLNDNGIKTTGLKPSEINFEQYLGALSASVRNDLAEHYDAGIQSDVAQLFKISNTVQIADFKNPNSAISKYLKSKGIQVDVSWCGDTGHISDAKAAGGGNYTKSGVSIITFKKDGKEFKVADANGNAALESEEVMYNQILGDINSDLLNDIGGKNAGLNLNSVETDGSGMSQDKHKLFEAEVNKLTFGSFEEEQKKKAEEAKAEEKKAEEIKEIDGKKVLTQKEYDNKIINYTEYLKKLSPEMSEKETVEEAKVTIKSLYIVK